MKTRFQKHHLYAAFVSVGVLFIALIPLSVFAEVVPLAPLPTNFGENTDTLGGYINTIFYTVIAAAAVLAVLRIVVGGFQYMTSEAVGQTKDSRTIITMAVLGLILLLASWLILSVINPNLRNLDVLDFEDLEQVSGQTTFSLGDLTQEEQVALEGSVAELTEGSEVTSTVTFGNDYVGGTIDITGFSDAEVDYLTNSCRNNGRRVKMRDVWTCETSDGDRYETRAGSCARGILNGGNGDRVRGGDKTYLICEERIR